MEKGVKDYQLIIPGSSRQWVPRWTREPQAWARCHSPAPVQHACAWLAASATWRQALPSAASSLAPARGEGRRRRAAPYSRCACASVAVPSRRRIPEAHVATGTSEVRECCGWTVAAWQSAWPGFSQATRRSPRPTPGQSATFAPFSSCLSISISKTSIRSADVSARRRVSSRLSLEFSLERCSSRRCCASLRECCSAACVSTTAR
eukprot:scaffold30462_cov28-Tisochrysis_lutea.AAC.6